MARKADRIVEPTSRVAIEPKIDLLEAEIVALKRRIERYESAHNLGISERTKNGLIPPSAEWSNSDEHFRLLVESIEDCAIFMLDCEGFIASWNKGAARIKGYSSEEILGRNFSCFYLAEDIATQKPAHELEIAKVEGHYSEQGWRVRKDGSVFWAFVVITALRDEAGVLRGFAKVTRDISEQKRAEEKTRLMVELAINAMILVDERGTVVLANPQTERLFGYLQDELIGQPVEMLVPDSARTNHPVQRAKFFANPSVRAMGAGRDLFGRRKDGTEFPVEIGLNPIESGDERFVLGSIVDITERKQVEESARKHLAELAHAGRLSTVGEMLSGLAHEINQPLAAAANYARACVRFAKSDENITREELGTWMEKAAAQSERASEIVKRLSAFMKKDRSLPSDLDINHVIERVIALPALMNSTSGISTPVTLRLELMERLPLIYADKVQIEQVLVNLIRNAIDAMDDCPEAKRSLSIMTQRISDVIKVSVTDTGHGITEEHQAQLFNPFFTTKAQGMGLGLSISRSIIEAHSGQLIVESAAGTGTTVSFLLPVKRGGDIP